MQAKDDHPEEQSANERREGDLASQRAPVDENTQEIQQEWTAENTQRSGVPMTPRPQAESGGQESAYRGVSEQIPFSFPTVSESYRQEQTAPYQPVTPQAPTPGGQGWHYPPRPEDYQTGTFSQPPRQQSHAVTRPLNPAQPGYYGQSPTPSGFGAFSQPPLGPTNQFQPGTTGAYPQRDIMTSPPRQPRSRLRTGAIIALGLLLAAVFASGLLSGWAISRGGSAASDGDNSFQPGNPSTVTVPQLTGSNADTVREAVINKVQPGVVQIDVVTGSQHALGSGVVIDGRGYIVTNNHVVDGANSIRVTLANGSQFPATVAGTDPADDLAVVKITPPSSGLTVVSFANSSQLKVGQAVLAIGSPLGNSETVTSGIVSALDRNVSEGQGGPTLPDAIQTDAPINPGNSGGALVDMQGSLVGIPTLNAIDTEFNTPANGLGFAIPSNRIKFIAQQIIATGHVSHTGRSMLGVSIETVDQSVAAQYNLSVNSGALIASVNSGSPAANAGLQTNDVVVQLGNTVVHSAEDVGSALLQHKPGETVAVKIYRGSKQLTVNVTLGELPASSS